MKKEKEAYKCPICGWLPQRGEKGRRWTHCPNCLSGIHKENGEGLECGGTLEPVGVWVRKNGEWAIIHRCRRCGHFSSNRIAADDNPMKLMSIAMRPLSQPPFPLERVEEMTALMGGDGCLGRRD